MVSAITLIKASIFFFYILNVLLQCIYYEYYDNFQFKFKLISIRFQDYLDVIQFLWKVYKYLE